MVQSTLNPANFTHYDQQKQSCLFSVLPPEIRYVIFSCALASTLDMTQSFDNQGYSTRPGYEAHHRTWTELLRTCKRVYMEAWFMPFMGSEHAFYLAWSERSPRRMTSKQKMQQYLNAIHDRHGEVHTGRIRIFAQQCELRAPFKGIFTMQHFHPISVTVTIRYTDTWSWENNDALNIGASWTKDMILPASVTSFSLDVESLKRRSAEVDWVAQQASERWHFTRNDGVLLLSCPDDISISQWTGSSVLGEERWIRDEVQPGRLDYYVGTITWRPSNEPLGGRPAENETLEYSETLGYNHHRVPPPWRPWNAINVHDLRRANISLDTPPDQVCELYQSWLNGTQPGSNEGSEGEESESEETGSDSYNESAE
ncbi:hypothetical protein N7462_008141 [Penicillium macrosclerotiorum]|uniref:uncharacterized protein n=1 Tax=Penicillium macrosclerotiorum TaxID=303699 RepID=UPI0025478C82|nr:uncharacterized protein N7462_008141 [Penicillium macrosclerotiorum]KAJ5679897.1 hypothetical protein N7462_008141 [Penicillium macrosclerotiorum]